MFIHNRNLRKSLGMGRLLSPDTGASGGEPTTKEDKPADQTQQQNVNYDDIFKKLDGILDKRSDGLAKSALKDNGYSDEELKEIITKYRETKQTQQTETNETLTTLQQENEQLKLKLQKAQVDDVAYKQALALGLNSDTVPYVTKLADLSKVMDDKGEIDEKLVTDAINKVLDDIPALKSNNQNNSSGFKIGSTGQQGEPNVQDGLSSIFGNKK